VKLVGLVLMLLVLAAPAGASAADPSAWQSPSGNIGCIYIREQLRCDMRKLGNAAPKRPASCDFDYGNAFGIGRDGVKGVRLCVSDFAGGAGPKLKYGRTWKRGGFSCRIRESGVRCTNRLKHGFELRLGRQRLF
jgi:hypothetical protein